jgi:arylsulfatase A-like enzyme
MQKQPNILFILIDDLGACDLGCTGSSFYETPRLDQLASEGIRFTEGYASAPVCSPTRASVLSGKYPARVGITQWIGGYGVGRLCDVPYFHQLMPSEYALPKALKERAGYQTWHVGKWHLGNGICSPEAHGFDLNIGGCEWGMPKYGYFSPWNIPGLENAPEGTYLTDHLTDSAIRLIEQHDTGKPFFMHLSHYAVHTPVQAPAELVAKYEQKAKDMGIDQEAAIMKGEYFPFMNKRDQHIQRRVMQSDPVYAAMVENLDTNIGRVLDALESNRLAEDTLVVFTSDNGGLATAEGSPTCNAPFSEGKGWVYEGGNRAPLLIRWPQKFAGGQVSRRMITSPDFYPTFLEVAGLAPIPRQHADGISFADTLSGSDVQRPPVYWHYPHYSNQGGTPAAAVRENDWKLIHFFEDGHDELYDLANDMGEDHNLAAEQPQVLARLRELLDAWSIDVGALLPQPNPFWAESH